MPSDFRQTTTALRNERGGGRRALAVLGGLGALLGVVIAWAVCATVPLYAVSQFARLQARDEVHPVDTLVAGRVTTVDLPIGGRVHQGDLLLGLDTTDVDLRLDDERARLRGLAAQTAALQAEIAAREEAVANTSSLGAASLFEAEATRSESAAEAGLAERERARTSAAHEAGVVAESDIDRADANMLQKRASMAARERRLSVLSSETRRDLADRRAQTDSLRRGLAELQTAHDQSAVQVKRLEVERARHLIRAPIDGVLGQIRAPQVGSVVAVGQTIAVVTPETALTLRADFAPEIAIGRVRPGQHARMRVAGFPWAQYGVLTATVGAVSSEVANGSIRVELVLDDAAAQPAAIPRYHGMVGEVEIEIEQVSPLALLLRAAGALWARPVASPPRVQPAPATSAFN